MDYRSLINRIRGHLEGMEAREKLEWERVRWQTALLLNVHTKQGYKIKPRDLITFPWEKKQRSAVVVDIEAMRKRWEKWDQKMNNGG